MDKKNLLRYSKLDQEAGSDDSESFLSDSESSPPAIRYRESIVRRCLLGLFFLISIAISGVLGAWIDRTWVYDADAYCVKRTSHYSPIIKEVEIGYHLQQYNGSLLKENIYRQTPSPEVDAAWEALGVNYRSIVIPENEAKRSGLLPDQVKVNPRYGGGFPAQIEGFHHLHCLNLVRQGLYYNFEYYHALKQGAFKNDDHIVRLHITHCLDILRQQLMCTVDTSIFGQVWVDPEAPFAYVDFNAKDHVCKNFEDIRKWAEPRQIPDQVPPDFLRFPEEGDKIYSEIP